MRRLYISTILAASLFCGSVNAATDATSKIEKVVVYPNGAMIKRTAKVNLKAGHNDVRVPLLTPQLDQESVRVGVKSGNATLVNVNHDAEVANRKQISNEASNMTKRAKQLRDSIDILMAKVDVLKEESALLKNNNFVGGDNGLSANTLQGVAEYIRKDMTDITTLNYKYRKRIDDLQDELTLVEQNLNLLYEKQMDPTSTLVLKIDAEAATSCELDLEYFVNNASWMPFYEVRISKRNDNLHLIQKAYVSQASKENWDKVSLTLSQNDPTVSNEKPSLGRWTVPDMSFTPTNNYSNREKKEKFIKILGIVRDDKGPLKNALVSCDDKKTQTDENGYYELLVQDYSTIRYNYGYNNTICSIGHVKNNVIVNNVQINQNLNSYQSSDYKQMYSNYIDQKRISFSSSWDNSNDDSSTPMLTARNVSHDVPGKNSIPEDGTDQEIVVKDMAVKAEYNYFAVPKLSKDVYLIASIPDWKNLDLLDGNVKLYLSNMYMGESFINARQTEDTLRLSIGKDKDIAVERTDLKNYSSKNLIKTSNKVQRDWKITVKNNKDVAVKVTIEDQYPVSTTSDIKVSLLNDGGATKNDPIEGQLTWVLNLKPGEKRELKFSYEVKSKDDIVVE